MSFIRGFGSRIGHGLRLCAREARQPDLQPQRLHHGAWTRGCSDRIFRSRYERVTGELKAQGFVVARADYLAAVEAPNCELVMDPAQAGADVLATARHLQGLPFVKPDAVNAIGWSFGGGLVLGMLEQVGAEGPRPVSAVVAYSHWFQDQPFQMAPHRKE